MDYAYDATGRRVSRTAGGTATQFVYGPGGILQERQGSTWTAAYTYGSALLRRNSEVPLFDALGSERTVTDGSGSVTGSIAYEAFGQPVATSGSSSSPYTFAATSGYRNDGDAGLTHVGARYYDAQVGRFVSRDTELDQRPYLYCDHDPVNALDPSGHDWFDDTSNFVAGWGDELTGGLTGKIRSGLLGDDPVDHDSGYYTGGQVVGAVHAAALVLCAPCRPGTSELQEVTHWGNPSPWVMTGGRTWRNWLFSGLVGEYGSGVTKTVPGANLSWPSGWEWWKGILGQRIVH